MSIDQDRYQQIRTELMKVYSEAVAEHIISPRNMGYLDDSDGSARITGPCGDTMEITLKVRNDTVTDCAFTTDGCATTIASGSMVSELSKGKNIVRALGISQQEVLSALGGLPEESEHCALLAANALKEALKDYLVYKKDPWKRAYKR